jgi:hypothetical protein
MTASLITFQHQTIDAPLRSWKWKRMGNLENELDNSELHTAGKRQRTTAQFPKERLPDSGESYCSAKEIERIDSWWVSGKWPQEYFEQDEDTRAYL